MKIVVCVKQVPSSNERFIDPATGGVIREGIASILNPFDAHAVEEALRIKRRVGGRITALSMGVPSVQDTLRRLLALGVDEAYLLSDPAFAGADTLATSYALAQAIQKLGGADVILCGRMATDGDTAQVGPMLAETLGINHITDVSRIDDIYDDSIIITHQTDDGYSCVRIPTPALITVTKEINVPRLPSINGVLRSRTQTVTVWHATDIAADLERVGTRGSATRVIKTTRPEPKTGCRILNNPIELLGELGL
ncbi:electron transfer flavoprotein subunit beta [Clostridia bacterium]|nr:electron transfer flavoprotein subunit beta [Clostridia bacterium]